MTRRISLLFVLILLLAACSPAETMGAEIPSSNLVQESTTASPNNNPTIAPEMGIDSAATSSSCAGEQAQQVAEMVASSYSFTSNEEVLTWFCAGAEFEDIALALETENTTSTAAEDMLQMRADGLTWEEIWQVVGLYDD